MKYIIVKHGTFLFPVIFPEMLTHAQVAAGFKPAEGFQIHSAGFYGVLNRDCTGESTSLQIGSKPGDRELCNAFIAGGDAMLQFAQLEMLERKVEYSVTLARAGSAPPSAQDKDPLINTAASAR